MQPREKRQDLKLERDETTREDGGGTKGEVDTMARVNGIVKGY